MASPLLFNSCRAAFCPSVLHLIDCFDVPFQAAVRAAAARKTLPVSLNKFVAANFTVTLKDNSEAGMSTFSD